MERIKHDLRLSEIISPFGVGAIVDVRGESLIAADTSWWDKKHSPEIHCERLLQRIGAGELREPPTHSGRVAKGTPSLLYWRFPEWRFCERCTKLSDRSGKDKGKWTNKCACGGILVPMRYIAICEKGSHTQDIPWFTWAHRGSDSGITDAVRFCRAYKELRFVRSAKSGEGLKSLRVECGSCKRSRCLSDLVAKSALGRDGLRCSGRQPWQDPTTAAVCDHALAAVQRGATSNYIAERLSALDIPEERPASVQLADKIRGHVYFDKLVADNGGPQSDMVSEWIAAELNTTKDVVLAVAGQDGTDLDEPLMDLKDGEWAAFVKKLEQSGRDDSGSDFVVDGWDLSPRPDWPSTLTGRIDSIGQVRRVREVRALLGFRRHDGNAERIMADLGPDQRRKPVYPAIEMFGEGIFLRFKEAVLAEWERHPEVLARADVLIGRRNATEWAHRLPTPEPRFIALHTIAHLLVRRLAYASGYASASLQERIYASSERPDRTAGVLIYTAAGDAQGTLGGLVRLGAPDKLVPLLLAALDDADVCSNDPVCIESDSQGSSSLNLSACHGCSLVSETSCESGNRLLDRQLVFGGRSVPGLLEGVLEEVRTSAA
ncbi:protein of unknown function [Microbacterium sp. ru370.1]|uniref:DUF1998 domain-containing protein n=1 Tax=unclassified Microbacterium TaxID=2609290 RepID=UPI00088687AA|nr:MULTISPECIES: DUF1998 domain-containing protein [unclassified Microbacterium]SDO33022.1 protein of unknown function [Microbacterium sp. ru370.1]SIT76950.1 protein of unknown function [Microbacterium sp. RU1D]